MSYLLVGLLGLGLSGCEKDLMMVRETTQGGVVAYLVKNEGTVLSSPLRVQALARIEQKCGRTYRITREGQIPRLSKRFEQNWSDLDQVSTELLWGLQFTCD